VKYLMNLNPFDCISVTLMKTGIRVTCEISYEFDCKSNYLYHKAAVFLQNSCCFEVAVFVVI
jgi:hypothetical protein